MYQAFVPDLQFCLNMQFGSCSSGIQSGDAMNQKELIQLLISESNNSMALENRFFVVHIEMCYYEG